MPVYVKSCIIITIAAHLIYNMNIVEILGGRRTGRDAEKEKKREREGETTKHNEKSKRNWYEQSMDFIINSKVLKRTERIKMNAFDHQ